MGEDRKGGMKGGRKQQWEEVREEGETEGRKGERQVGGNEGMEGSDEGRPE